MMNAPDESREKQNFHEARQEKNMRDIDGRDFFAYIHSDLGT